MAATPIRGGWKSALRTLMANTLARRFLLAFVLTVVLPITAIGILLARINGRILLRDTSRRIEQTLDQLALAIDEEAKRISLLAAALACDPLFIGYGAGYNQAADPVSAYLWSKRMEQHLDSFFNYSNKIGAVLVFFRDKAPYVYRNNPFLFETGLAKGPWFEEVTREKGRTRILPDLGSHSISSASRPVLSVAVCPDAATFRQGLEALVVSFKVSHFDRILEGRAGSVGEELYLVNADGTVLLGSVPPGTEPGSGARRAGTEPGRSGRAAAGPAVLEGLPPDGGGPVFRLQGRQRVMVSSIPLPFASWRLASIIGTERITRPFDLALAAARCSIAAFLFLFVVFIALFFREIVRPVRQVVATMRQVAGGDYSVAVGETGLAELAELGRTFNAMVAQVRRLTREKEQKERERSRLELTALRLKLNPHFLTNTLNSIRLMAVMSRADNIKEMTGALMKVLNDSFRDEGGTATVAAELEVLESYTHIMKVRYGDRFDVRYQVAPPARPLYILRMLLQPLVENAILHGVSDLPRKGEILVRGDIEDGRLYLEVADNGRGMAREQIEEALAGERPEAGRRSPPGEMATCRESHGGRERPEPGMATCRESHGGRERPEHHGLSRVGLHSVRSRILLAYGEPYGLRIASEPGAGTRITLCLPVLPDREAAGDKEVDVPPKPSASRAQRGLSSAAPRRCRKAGAADE